MSKYFVISDLHLGQRHTDRIAGGQYCLLSEIPPSFPEAHRRAKDTRDRLRTRLAHFAAGQEVTLVTVGDLLDLSLASVQESLADLVALLRDLPEVSSVVNVIGNHDHHLWSMHSEWERSLLPMQRGELPAAGSVYVSTDKRGERHEVLTSLLCKQLERQVEMRIAYPTFAFDQDPIGPGQGSLYYFTHGHLFGGMYTTLSDILEQRLQSANLDPEAVAATVNGPLIEFIYWSLSQAGNGMGADGLMEQVYSDIQRGDDSLVGHLIQRAVKVMIPDGMIPLVPDSLEHWIIVAAAMHMIKTSHLQSPGGVSRERHAEREETRKRLQRWAERSDLLGGREAHVIYGHTHVADQWTIPGSRLHSYNMGSWLVEPGHEEPESRVLLIDTEVPSVAYEEL